MRAQLDAIMQKPDKLLSTLVSWEAIRSLSLFLKFLRPSMRWS
jgi:hypothetical protein